MTQSDAAEPTRLMRCGRLTHESGRQDAASFELCRGMKIASRAGDHLGFLAAVLVNRAGEVNRFLLLRPETPLEYRLISAEDIETVHDAAVTLKIAASEVDALPVYERGA